MNVSYGRVPYATEQSHIEQKQTTDVLENKLMNYCMEKSQVILKKILYLSLILATVGFGVLQNDATKKSPTTPPQDRSRRTIGIFSKRSIRLIFLSNAALH